MILETLDETDRLIDAIDLMVSETEARIRECEKTAAELFDAR